MNINTQMNKFSFNSLSEQYGSLQPELQKHVSEDFKEFLHITVCEQLLMLEIPNILQFTVQSAPQSENKTENQLI